MTDTEPCPQCGGVGYVPGPILCPGFGCTCDGYSGGCVRDEKCEYCDEYGQVPVKCDECGEYMEHGKCLDEECEGTK